MRETWYIEKLSINKETSKGFGFNYVAPNSKSNRVIEVFLDGYVLPRIQHYRDLCHLEPLDLIIHLRHKYGKEFIHYIKGSFCIVIIEDNSFEVYTDTHSIHNFFIYDNGNDFIVSNSMRYISERVQLEQDIESSAVFSLVSHFVGNDTLFKNVYSSEAGTYVEYKNNVLSVNNYWIPEQLLIKNKSKSSLTDEEIAIFWKELARQYVDYLKPKSMSLTITSGNDSRMVLSALLANKYKINSFTFGNPDSLESEISMSIAKAAGLTHENYFVANPTSTWLQTQANEILDFGGGMISFMRAHRFDAYQKNKLLFPEIDMVFTGLMGGEYMKLPPAKTPSIPNVFLDLIDAESDRERYRILRNELDAKGFFEDKADINKVWNKIKQLTDRVLELNMRERGFILHYLFYGCAHHAQEARVLQHIYKYPVHLFMDIDFLSLLSSSSAWYPNNEKTYNRLTHSKIMISITHKLAPQLSKLPYGKKGQYTAEDILYKPIRYLIKRILSYVTKENKKYPPGFFMGKWLNEFCGSCLEQNRESIMQLHNIKYLIEKNREFAQGIDEYSWQIITNPINIDMIKRKYQK